MPDPDEQTEEPAARQQRLAELFQLHGNAIYAYVAQRVPQKDAEDLVSEVFLVAWRRLETVYVGEERAWLFGIARRLLMAHRRQVVNQSLLWASLEQRDGSELIDLADRVVARESVLRALATLSGQDRDALILIYWYDLSTAEAAKAMGCTRAAFTVRVHRARVRLSRALRGDVSARGEGFSEVTHAAVRRGQ